MSSPSGCPYSPVVVAGRPGCIVSGQVGAAADGSLVAGGPLTRPLGHSQPRRHSWQSTAPSSTDVVKTTVFMVDIDNFPVVNGAYAAAFGEHRPAVLPLRWPALPWAPWSR